MSAKRKGLGRGLDALLGGAALIGGGEDPGDQLRQIPVDLIQRGKYQPRRDMREESLKDLADSIKAQGVVQPIVVRPLDERRFEIIAGERRWRAAQMAGLESVPAVVRDVPDRTAIAIALIENIQRADLNPLEEAEALQRLISEFQMTHQQASEAVGRSRAAVTNLLRLLELTREVQDLVRQGALEMGHARALLGLKGPAQTD
ncbi:MAG TPA: ParB/RepB/Spo0J family partition protein, partial [Gammaproteobacteria bacterium]|nr:ParB/RepB/Spo0J family partition protein [Gammaproteobacteria bacterium]